ncbi:MAG: 30S ribosome-binding factor RbfA [Acidimicrobiia bacterium]
MSGTRRYPRTARLNELLREIVASELERIDDARLGLVSVTGVRVEPDLRHALVWVSSLPAEVAAALEEHRGRLRTAIARGARIKRAPELRFAPDPAVAAGTRVDDILRHLRDAEAG